MKDHSLSLKQIYGCDSVHALQNRINFIAHKRKQKWISIENTTPLPHNQHDEPPRQNATSVRRFFHSKVRWMEVQDLKARRYQQCRQDSDRIMRQLEERRAVDLQDKRLRRLKVVREEQQARQALQEQQQHKLQQSRQVREGVDAALQLRTVQLQQQLQRQEEIELVRYQEELSYRSLVMRRIQQLIQQDKQINQ